MNVYDSLLPIVGDLVIIGELTKETTECLVKSIRSSDDLTATLELVDLAEEIYDADQGEIHPLTQISHMPLILH